MTQIQRLSLLMQHLSQVKILFFQWCESTRGERNRGKVNDNRLSLFNQQLFITIKFYQLWKSSED